MQLRWAMAGAMCLLAAWACAAEVAVKAPVQSVGLFKNGLAVVRRTVTLPGPGVYRIEELPTPVHGTFWVESARGITATAGMRTVETDLSQGPMDLQNDLAGRSVRVYLREKDAFVQGKVVEVAKPDAEQAWNRRYERPGYYNDYSWMGGNGLVQQGRYLILDAANGREYIDVSQIERLSLNDERKTVRRRQPVLLLQAEAAGPEAEGKPEIAVTISYLAKGLSWAPSYRVNLKDEKHLVIEQQAVVRNELMDVQDAEFYLISGFPSMQFAHVVSPLSPSTSWVSFFQQLGQQVAPGAASMSNVSQQVAMNRYGEEMDIPVAPEGEGVDIHYQSIGRKTLAEGDAMSLPVATAEAQYEPVVEWFMPEARSGNGHERQRGSEEHEDVAWDAVRFSNPFQFPMTTAPAMILRQGRFSGQRQSYWVSPGEQTTLRITKALSLRTRATEKEMPGERQIVFIGRNDFRKVPMKGELSAQNHRSEDVKLIIRRQFSGELVRADADPKVIYREEGLQSINRRNELTWTVPLKSGEALTIEYEYTFLVDN